jgi:hypothetical protein
MILYIPSTMFIFWIILSTMLITIFSTNQNPPCLRMRLAYQRPTQIIFTIRFLFYVLDIDLPIKAPLSDAVIIAAPCNVENLFEDKPHS